MDYRILDHTADIGLEAYGRTVGEAFINAARGMFSILSPAKKIQIQKSFPLEINAESREELLVAWLNKLLYLFDTEKVLLGHFEISKLDQHNLVASVAGESIDPARHKIKTYIKAATHHQVFVIVKPICAVRVVFDV